MSYTAAFRTPRSSSHSKRGLQTPVCYYISKGLRFQQVVEAAQGYSVHMRLDVELRKDFFEQLSLCLFGGFISFHQSYYNRVSKSINYHMSDTSA